MNKNIQLYFQINDVLNRDECRKNELDQTVHNLLKEMQLLESAILQKSETISIVTTSMNVYHNAVSNCINEVLNMYIAIMLKIHCDQ